MAQNKITKKCYLITVYRDKEEVPFDHIESTTLCATGPNPDKAAEKIAKAVGWADGFWSFTVDKWMYLV